MSDDRTATCRHLVRRPTGHAATPFTRAYDRFPCGRPTVYVVRDDEGSVLDWSCGRHRPELALYDDLDFITVEER